MRIDIDPARRPRLKRASTRDEANPRITDANDHTLIDA
jgi:hypothetical protein